MARNKGAGKKRKAAARKPATRRPSVKRSPANAAAPTRAYPCNVIVNKGAERLPVMVKDAAHYAQLADQFGESSIEVQS